MVVNFYTSSEDRTEQEDVHFNNKFELSHDWNKWVADNDYSEKVNIYIISLYNSKKSQKICIGFNYIR